MSLLSWAALLALAGGAAASPVETAANFTLSGTVADSAGVAIPGARVRVVELGRVTTTDESGLYRFGGIPAGTYRVSFAALGLLPRLVTVTVSGDTTLDITLQRSLIELPTIQVTASATATDPLTSPQPTAVISGAVLDYSQSPSLGETLNQVAGVHSLSTGTGIGKPVIRGLTSNRVLVLDNGQRTETAQWGDEHGPNVETANAERIEVIRGPASVLYGSDALGGVINVIQRPLPDALETAPFVRGSVSAGYATNNRQPDGAVLLEGASGGFGARLGLSARASEDVRTPDYVLWNSENRAAAGSLTAGHRGAWGSFSAAFSTRNERVQLTDEDPAESPTQRIRTDRARVIAEFPAGASRLELNAGYEMNRRREFESEDDVDVALGLRSRTLGADVHLHHAPVGRFGGTFGVSAQRVDFQKFGEETLIPENRSSDLGIFAFEQMDAGRWHLSLGARFDYRHLDVDQDTVIGVAEQTRSWQSLSGNLGLLFKLADPVGIAVNVGRGFRAPSAFDLYAFGVHEGTLAFERGDSALRTEKSLNSDLSLRIQTANVAIEVGGFLNLVDDFIYTVPSGEVDSASGLEIFDVTQGDARLVGVEFAGQYHPTDYLHLQGTLDFVRGTNTTTGNPLPAMPPFRATWFARLEGGDHGWFSDPYLQLGGETNARQTRLDPAEAQFFDAAFEGAGYRSRGYTILNLGTGLALPYGRSTVRFDLQVRNLLDTAYSNFLSRIKTNARDPGMGRSVMARVSADF